MKKLFKYYIKKRISILVALFVICLLVFIIGADPLDRYGKAREELFIRYPIVLGIITCIIPVIEFSFKMKKTNIDLMYSFPIKRDRLYLTKYLVGLFELLVPFVLASFVSIIVISTKENAYNLGFVFLYIIALVLVSAFSYTILSFVFIRQNTMLDGIILMLLSILALPMLVSIVKQFAYMPNFYSMGYEIFAPYSFITSIFIPLMVKEDYIWSSLMYNEIVGSSLIVMGAIIAFVYTAVTLKNDKSENCMQLSNAVVGYKILIPIYSLGALSTRGSYILSSTPFYATIIIIITFLAFATWNRSFKLSKGKWIFFLTISLFDIFMLLANLNDWFCSKIERIC